MNIILRGQLADKTLLADKQVATGRVLGGNHQGHVVTIVTVKALGGHYSRRITCNCGLSVGQESLTISSAEPA